MENSGSVHRIVLLMGFCHYIRDVPLGRCSAAVESSFPRQTDLIPNFGSYPSLEKVLTRKTMGCNKRFDKYHEAPQSYCFMWINVLSTSTT